MATGCACPGVRSESAPLFPTNLISIQPQEDTTGGFARADAFLLGRGTYDISAAHWPRVTEPHDPVAKALNTLPKHVASHTRRRFDWNGSQPVADVVREVPALKAPW